MKKGIRIYNLYPKLVGSMDKWIEKFDFIQNMNFNWVYVNPINAPGFSGSDYAIKDYYLYHPLFVTGEYNFDDLESQREKGNELLKKVCEEAEKRGMKVMLDLVINHTAIDCPLTKENPEWYMHNPDGSIKNPGADDNGNWVTWGDLAQIDNENSKDKDGLWEYWLDMILHYASLGIKGFRCDAAYHVPASLWRFITKKVKTKYPETIFIAETLGCTPNELLAVADTGFDYVMNSFKWWDYKSDWFLKDYRQWAGKYPSLTFPENHDTSRFAEEVNGNKDLSILKYELSAYFCSSVATTIGFEYGFRNKIDVVKTNPMSWEEAKYDISNDIAQINKTKSTYNILQEDNIIYTYDFDNPSLFSFTKESLDGGEKIMLVANLSGEYAQSFYIPNLYEILGSDNIQDISYKNKIENKIENSINYTLNTGEVKLFYVKR